jgi:hypothetical protein
MLDILPTCAHSMGHVFFRRPCILVLLRLIMRSSYIVIIFTNF